MTTSQQTPFLSEIIESVPIPQERLAYFRARLKNRLHSYVLSQFLKVENQSKLTKAELARKLGKKPEQITRWLGAPGNWELDTLSDLLLGMGFEPNFFSANLRHGAILPNDEAWKKADDQLAFKPNVGLNTQASNETWFGGNAFVVSGQLLPQQRQNFR